MLVLTRLSAAICRALFGLVKFWCFYYSLAGINRRAAQNRRYTVNICTMSKSNFILNRFHQNQFNRKY